MYSAQASYAESCPGCGGWWDQLQLSNQPMEMGMDCLVCGIESQKVESDLDGTELKCPDCGHFGVSGSLIAKQQGRHFDVEQTRWWLERLRVAFPSQLPVIMETFALRAL